ncbi:MAG TPA: AsmA-like C-terminal region-containing protein [Stellaceae bacterium]|nr:AsmA-like C-terminal region-containing protein [Stellaceae bacterium]
MQHIGHHAHRLLVWLGGVAAVVILVAVVGIWRLLQGPIELDRLVPYVEQALQRSGAGIGVTVAGVSIGLDRDTHQLDLRVQNVRLSLPSGEKLANFPEMATSFSLGAMLGGRIEPTRLVVEHPVLALTRDASGALSAHFGNPDATAERSGLEDALGLLAPLRPGAPWGELRRIVIRDATIIVDDHMTGRVLRADRAAATLERSGDGATGDLSVAIALGNTAPELRATYRYAAATQRLDLKLAVDGLDPAALAPFSPILAPLAQAQFPVSGTADIRFNLATGKPEGGRLDLGFGAGQIETDLLASGSLPVAKGELHADYAPESAELRLEKLALDLHGGATLVVDGKLAGLRPQLVSAGAAWPASLAGTLGVSLTHAPVSRVSALWPRGVSPGGRKWVAANVSDGVLDEMAVQLAVTVDPASLAADFSGAHGTMRYHDLTVDYFNGLPPVKKVSGTAALNDRRLDFAIAGGVLKSLKATGGSLSITDIGAPVETLTVDVGLSGGLQDALEAIDSKPLRYARDAGIDPARVGGKVETQLHFKLPLLADLKLADVDYGAKATLSGVSYAKVAFDHALTDGTFAIDLGHIEVHAQGTGKFDGSAATVDGNLYFHPKSGPRVRYRIGLTLDDAARQRLGWDFVADRLSGPVGIDLTYTVPTSGPRADVEAVLDLGAAGLVCDEAGWKKPPQAPGSAKLVVALNDDVVVGVPEIDIKAAGLNARFAVALNPDDRRVERVDIRHVVIGDNDIAGTVSRRQGGGWHADIRGARLDLHRALKRALNDDSPDSPTPLAIDAHVARLMLGPHREARDVSATLLRDGGNWQSIRLDGSYADGHRLALSLGGPEGNRRLHFESDDLGASFALFGIADNVVGGHLSIDGTLGEVDGHRVVRAHIDGTDYRLVRAPALTQLLSLTSLDGIAAMLSGSGIPFTNLRGDVSFSRGIISLSRMVAYGGALGISADGWLNPGDDRIEVDGTLAPAYALNSVLGNFPVLGSLLMGGEGQGLFAARFHLGGSNDDPTVTVNPLSALTPGLLRHLFDPFSGTGQPGASPPAPPPAAGSGGGH